MRVQFRLVTPNTGVREIYLLQDDTELSTQVPAYIIQR